LAYRLVTALPCCVPRRSAEGWTVQHISHLYDEGIAAGSDHALVVADLPPHNHTDPRKDQQQPRASVRHYLLQMWVLRRNLLGF
jgi:hypothetical protein